MREILFKAKRKDNGEWVEGFLFDDGMAEVKRYFIGRLVIVPYKGNCDDDWDIEATDFYEINPDTLCQFTGLYDKNGNRIWENDIVSAWSTGSHVIGKVVRRVDGLYFILTTSRNDFWNLCPDKDGNTTVEIIGNIFDNADLLESGINEKSRH